MGGDMMMPDARYKGGSCAAAQALCSEFYANQVPFLIIKTKKNSNLIFFKFYFNF